MPRLADIEAELLQHAQAEKRRWQEVAKLLMQVDRDRLWDGQADEITVTVE